MQRAIFLDRDNTLIDNDGDLGDPALVVLRAGVADALRSFRAAAYRLVVVTNQAGVARGKYTENEVDAVNQRIAELVDEAVGASGLIDRFYYCPYHPQGTVAEYRREHPWRKPQPGMIVQAANDLDIDLQESWLIGDQPRDVDAGASAGCRTILLSGDAEVIKAANPTATVETMSEAVQVILEKPRVPRARKKPARPAPTPQRGRKGETAETKTPALNAPAPAASPTSTKEVDSLRRAVLDLSDEMRSERQRRTEFTPLRMASGILQLTVLLLVLLALLSLGQTDEMFYRWMAGALLLQLTTIALLLLDLRG